MVKVPTPAVVGLNVPVAALVIPVPLQVPPGSTAAMFIAADDWQNGPAGEMVGLNKLFTVMVKVCGVPLHPRAVGVTVTVEVMGPPVGLSAVKDGIFPEPDAANPVVVLLLVQL